MPHYANAASVICLSRVAHDANYSLMATEIEQRIERR